MQEETVPLRSRRTGGRSARVRNAVLEAAVEALCENGIDAFSIREVAARANVHETSIYRRWGTKTNLAVAALLSKARLEIPTPDTGSLREDLLALVSMLAAFINSPLGENLVRIALRQDLPNANTTRDQFWTDRFARGSVIFDRAQTRGELRADVDRFLTLETLVAPLYLRLLLTREPLTDTFLEQVVDLVMHGIATQRA